MLLLMSVAPGDWLNPAQFDNFKSGNSDSGRFEMTKGALSVFVWRYQILLAGGRSMIHQSTATSLFSLVNLTSFCGFTGGGTCNFQRGYGFVG